MDCHYCNKSVELVTGEVIYPHRPDLYAKKFWLCKPCKAYCGCHGETDKPLGTVATANLRRLRSQCHALFDPLWKVKRKSSRGGCYRWLSEKCNNEDAPLSLRTGKHIHFGSSNEEECEYIIELLSKEAPDEQG